MFTRVSPTEAQELLKNNDLYVVDIRDATAYEAQHIIGAQHLPRHALPTFCTTADKNKSVLVYCYHGNSSKDVARHLTEQGFTNVFSLDGGFAAWNVTS